MAKIEQLTSIDESSELLSDSLLPISKGTNQLYSIALNKLVVNSLDDDATFLPLSAAKGKELKEEVDKAIKSNDFSSLEELGSRYNIEDIKVLVNNILNKLKKTTSIILCLVLPFNILTTHADEYLTIHSAKLDEIYNDDSVITNVSVSSKLVDKLNAIPDVASTNNMVVTSNDLTTAISNIKPTPVVDIDGKWMIPYGLSGDTQVYRKVEKVIDNGNTLEIGNLDYILTNGVFQLANSRTAFELPLGGIELVGDTVLRPVNYSYNGIISPYTMQVLPDNGLTMGSWQNGDSYTFYGTSVYDIRTFTQGNYSKGGASYKSSYVSANGNYFYVVYYTSNVRRYDLLVPYDISTKSNYNINNTSVCPAELAFSSDGTIFMYKNSGLNNILYIRNLTNAWDVSSFNNESSISLSTLFNLGYSWGSYTFSNDGYYGLFGAYISESGRLVKIKMTTPFDISTAVVIEDVKIFDTNGYIYGIAVNELNKVLYVYKSDDSNGNSGRFYSYRMEPVIESSPLTTKLYVDNKYGILSANVTSISNSVVSLSNSVDSIQSTIPSLATINYVDTQLNNHKSTQLWSTNNEYLVNATGELFKTTIQNSNWLWTRSDVPTITALFNYAGTTGSGENLRYQWWHPGSSMYLNYYPIDGRFIIYNATYSTTTKLGYQLSNQDPSTSNCSFTNVTFVYLNNASGEAVFTPYGEYPDSTPYDKFATTNELNEALSNVQGNLTVLEYGVSTWSDFQTAISNNTVVLCRCPDGSSPPINARYAVLGYYNPSQNQVEFQYLRKRGHSIGTQSDELFIYILNNQDTWTKASTAVASLVDVGTGLNRQYKSGSVVIFPDTDNPTLDGTKLITNGQVENSLSQIVADEFSTNLTYSVGDVVVYNGARYECTNDVSIAGNWTGDTNWMQSNIESALSRMLGPDTLSGRIYDFNSNSNIIRALSDIVRVLGGSITNNPVSNQ